VPVYFLNKNRRGATPMPRPKTELTKSGRAIGVRLTEWEFQEWKKLGGPKWLRALLRESKLKNVQKSQTT
jgi:hypothetical protein